MKREPDVERLASFGQMFQSSLLAVLVCGLLVSFGFAAGPSYGYFMFMGVPLLLGALGSAFLEWYEPRPLKSHWYTMFLGIGLACVVPLLLVFEGIICIVMALPLIIPVAMIGMLATRALMGIRWRNQTLMFSLAVVVPIGLAWEGQRVQDPELRTVTTQVIVDAPPSEVWPYLFDLEVDPPTDWLLRSGVAHPTVVRSGKRQIGSWRECVLSTGTMRETIVECEPNQKMTFAILNTPASMKELNPFGEVKAEHLNDWCTSVRGEIRLQELAGGRTLLTGQSWYTHRYAPGIYWSLWTDSIVSRVHHLVFGTIQGKVEAPVVTR